jgi:hypothetical protein
MIRSLQYCFLVGLSCCSVWAAAETSPTAPWHNNLRWALDFSSRHVDKSGSDAFFVNALGFDLHKVFSGSDGDIGTLVFQPYIVNFSDANKAPYYFDGSHNELTWRIANFNYTALSQGQFNVRIGHFEVPFGLEQNQDTNGTLRQYTYQNRGIKADWGVSVNGILPSFDYELALTRGSGNDLTDRDSPYIVAGRIGSPYHKNFIVGLSYFKGEVLNAIGTVKRERWGLDLTQYRYHWEYLLELSAGEDEETDVLDGLAEISWRNSDETLHYYGQFKHSQFKVANSWEEQAEAVLGINWMLPSNITLSGEWRKPTQTRGNMDDGGTLILQVRARI